MATINEDAFESQQNSSSKQTRNNEEIREGHDVKSGNFLGDFSSLSNIPPDNKDSSWSKVSGNELTAKARASTRYKNVNNAENSKITKALKGSSSAHHLLTKSKLKPEFKLIVCFRNQA